MRASGRRRQENPVVVVKGPSVFRRVLVFLFAMFLGSVLTIGTIVGAMYGIVAWVTVDKVGQYADISAADRFLAEDSVLRGLTILEMIEEYMAVSAGLSEASINSLIEDYGLILPEKVVDIVPPELFELKLSEYAEDGVVNVILEHMTFGRVFEVVGKGVLPAGVEAKLLDRSIGLAVSMDLAALLEDIYVGDVLGIAVERDENGVVNPVLAEGEQAGIMHYLATIDAGELLGADEKFPVLQKTLDRIPLDAIIGGEGGDSIFSALSGKYLGEILRLDGSGFTLDLDAMTDDLYLGAVLGLEKGEDGIWYENGKEATGFYRALAGVRVNELASTDFESLFDDVYIGELMELERGAETSPATETQAARYEWLDGGVAVDSLTGTLANLRIGTLFEGNISLDSLGFSDLALYEILGYEKRDGKWYDGETEIAAALSAFMEMTLDELSGGVDALYIGELMGYTLCENEAGELVDENGNPVTKAVFLDGDGNVLSGITAAIAVLQVSDLNDSEKIDDTIGDITIADVMGYTQSGSGWVDGDGNTVTGIFASLADCTINTLADEVETVKIGDVLGYTYKTTADGVAEDGWYDENGDKVTGIFSALGDSTIKSLDEDVENVKIGDVLGYQERADGWYDENGDKVTGIFSALGGSTISTLADDVEGVKIGDVLGYTYKTTADGVAEDGWYDENGDKVTGIFSALGDSTIKTLDDDVESVAIGDVLGYEKRSDGWYDENGDKVTGIFSALGDSTIATLADDVEDVAIGDVLGYEKGADGWYDENGDKVTGIFSALGDSTIKTLDSDVETVAIGDVLGYEKRADGWYDENGDKVTGIFSALGDSTIATLDQDVETVKIGDVLGYEKKTDGWYDENGDKVTGIFSALGDSTIATLDQDVETVKIGDVLGYEKKIDGWYDENGQKVTGIFSALGDSTIATLDKDVEDVAIGDVLGYTYKTTADGVTEEGWYDENGDKVTGIFSALGDSTIATLDQDVKSVEIGKVLGYEKVGEGWCERDTEGNLVPVNGIFGALGDSTIDSIDADVHTVALGKILGYEKKTDGWYDENGDKVTGIFAVLSDSTIDTLKDDAQDVAIGDVLGYEKKSDGWYDENGQKVTGIFSALGDSSIADLDKNVENVAIGDVLGYEKVGDDWCERDAGGNLVPVTGIFSVLSNSTIATLDENVNDVYLGEIMGYKAYDIATDGAVTDETVLIGFRKGTAGSYEYPTGLLSAFADMKISDLENESAFGARVRAVRVGEAMGYTYTPHATLVDDPANGLWYGTWYDGSTPVGGVIGTLANYPVGEVDGAVQSVTLADALGYKKTATGWQKSDGTEENNPLILTFLDKKVGEMSAVMDDLTLADALGYTYNTATSTWQKSDGSDETNPMILALVDKKLSEIGTVMEELTLADIMGYTYKTATGDGVAADGWYDGDGNAVSGFVMILGPDTKLTGLGEKLANLDNVSVGALISNGILKPEHGVGFGALFSGEDWQSWSLDRLVDELIHKATPPFS